MTTIRFLAQLAGVSHSTVSRALRDDPAIGPAMRQRIQELAREYHYRPNQLMQGLLSGKSGIIGMVLPRVSFPYCARMLSAVLTGTLDAGYRVLTFETQGHYEKTQYAIHTLVEQRVDGVLLYTGHLTPVTRDCINELRSHDIVPVGIDATISEVAIDIVQTDEMRLARLAVDYLLALGHTTIAHIGPQLAHHQVGRGLAITHILQQRLLSTAYRIDTAGKTYDQLEPSALVDTLLAFHPRPTAVIAWEDHIAAKVLLALNQRGFSIPRDISIIGCGNLPVGEFTIPPLTTIEQFPEQIGRTALDVLLARLQAPKAAHPVVTQAIPPQLIKRASCAHLG